MPRRHEDEDETESEKCNRFAEILRDTPGGLGEIIDYLEERAAQLEEEEE